MDSHDSLTEPPRDRFAWAPRVLMLAGGVMTSLSFIGVIAVLPQIETALAHDATDRLLVKLLVSIGGVAMVVGAPLGGLLSDRFGLRRVLILFCLLYALAGTAGLYVSSLYALLFSRLMLGLAAAGIATMSMALINTRMTGNDRMKWMGLHVSVASASAVILSPILGMMGEYGWRWPFALYGLSLPLALLGFALSDSRVVRAAKTVVRGPSLLTWFPFRFAVLALLIGSVTYMPVAYLPFVLRDVGVTSPTTISLVGLAETVIGAIMAMVFGTARRRVSSNLAFVMSFTFIGSGMLIVAIAPSLMVVVLGVAITGLGIGWTVPNLMTAWVNSVSPAQQGRAVGLIKASLYLSGPLATLAVEPLTRTAGPRSALAAVAVLSACGVIIFLLRLRAGRGDAPTGPQTAPATADAG